MCKEVQIKVRPKYLYLEHLDKGGSNLIAKDAILEISPQEAYDAIAIELGEDYKNTSNKVLYGTNARGIFDWIYVVSRHINSACINYEHVTVSLDMKRKHLKEILPCYLRNDKASLDVIINRMHKYFKEIISSTYFFKGNCTFNDSEMPICCFSGADIWLRSYEDRTLFVSCTKEKRTPKLPKRKMEVKLRYDKDIELNTASINKITIKIGDGVADAYTSDIEAKLKDTSIMKRYKLNQFRLKTEVVNQKYIQITLRPVGTQLFLPIIAEDLADVAECFGLDSYKYKVHTTSYVGLSSEELERVNSFYHNVTQLLPLDNTIKPLTVLL